MNVKNKVVYGILGLLGFLPLSILMVVQSIFALDAAFDAKLIIDADKITLTGEGFAYDNYNNDISLTLEQTDENGKPILYSIVEATNKYVIIDFHGGEIDDIEYYISGVQWELADNTKTELVRGVVYIQFKNVSDGPDDFYIRTFIKDMNELYEDYFEQPAGTVSYVWFKIITASLGTLIGMATVGLVVLRKSTKALAKRYWRVAVLVALVEGTIILGLITWIIADIFQVFFAASVGWLIFLGAEKGAKHFGYIETPQLAQPLDEAVIANVEADVNSILAKYRK